MTTPTFAATRMLTKLGKRVTPSIMQEWALDAIQDDAVLDLYISGGLGSGKTTVGAWGLTEAIAFNYMATEGEIPVHYAVVSSDSKQLQRVTMEAWRGAFNAATGHKGSFSSNPLVERWSKQDHRITLKCNAVIDYASGHNGAQALEGGEYSFIWIDEPAMCREETQPRIRERCRELIPGTVRGVLSTGTPRLGFSLPWLRERFGALQDGIPSPDGACRVALPTRDNLPNLPRGYEDRLRNIYSPMMAEALLEGRFVMLGNRVYATYDDESITEYQYNPDLPVVLCWDGAIRRPYFGALQEVSSGEWILFDEIADTDLSIDRQAQTLVDKPWMPMVRTIVYDPSSDNSKYGPGISERSVLRDRLKEHGFYVDFACSTRPADRHIPARCERLRMMLCSADETRRLKLATRLTARRYPNANDNKPVVGAHRALLEQPFKEGSDEPDRTTKWDYLSHPCDAIGYFAVWAFRVGGVDATGWIEAKRQPEREPVLPGPKPKKDMTFAMGKDLEDDF